MAENLVDDRLILDAGNHPGFTAALRAGRHIDVEYPLQTLRPGHGPVPQLWRLIFVFAFPVESVFTAFGRCHLRQLDQHHRGNR